MVDQGEEEKTPNGCESGRGCTRPMQPNGGSGGRGEISQRLWQRMRSHKLYFVPMVDQAEEEKIPNSCEGRRGHTWVYMTQQWNWQKRRKLPVAVKADEVIYSSPFEKETWVGQTHQPWQATGLGETTLTKKQQSFEVRRYTPSWQGVNRVPTHHSITWPCKWLSINVGSSLWTAARLGPPASKGSTSCYWLWLWFSCRQGRTE